MYLLDEKLCVPQNWYKYRKENKNSYLYKKLNPGLPIHSRNDNPGLGTKFGLTLYGMEFIGQLLAILCGKKSWFVDAV
jgi:hypothetical protein